LQVIENKDKYSQIDKIDPACLIPAFHEKYASGRRACLAVLRQKNCHGKTALSALPGAQVLRNPPPIGAPHAGIGRARWTRGRHTLLGLGLEDAFTGR